MQYIDENLFRTYRLKMVQNLSDVNNGHLIRGMFTIMIKFRNYTTRGGPTFIKIKKPLVVCVVLTYITFYVTPIFCMIRFMTTKR